MDSTEKVEVPFCEYAITQSLSQLFRRAGHEVNSNSVPHNESMLNTLEAFAKAASVTLYYLDDSSEVNYVFYGKVNASNDDIEMDTGVLAISKTNGHLYVLDGVPRVPFSHYEGRYEGEVLEELESPMIDSEGELDDNRMGVDFDSSGWFFEVYRDGSFEPKIGQLASKSNVREERVKSTLSPKEYNDWDLYINIPVSERGIDGRPDVFYACAFSSEGRVHFVNCTYYSSPSILVIPDGLGICMLHKATQVFVMTRECVPVVSFDLYRDLSELISKLEDKAYEEFRAIGWPVAESPFDVILGHIDQKYKGIRATSYSKGQCMYTYTDGLRNNISYSATHTELLDDFPLSVMDVPMTIEGCSVIVTLNAVENALPLLIKYYPQRPCVLYGTVETFFAFLMKTGYTRQLPDMETTNAVFGLYLNICKINNEMERLGGTLAVNMAPFFSASQFNEAPTLQFDQWVEQSSGLKYLPFYPK